MSLQLDPHDLRTSRLVNEQALIAHEQGPPAAGRFRRAARTVWARLAYTVGLLAGLFVAAAVWQHNAPDGLRISQLIGAFGGDTVSAQIAASLEAEKARTAALNEENERLQMKLIATQTRAQELVAAAQSQAQQEVQAMQGRVQIAAAAYQTLYERSNRLAAAYMQTTQALITTRTEIARGNQGGSTLVANIADLAKGFAMFSGDSNLYQQADAIKRSTAAAQQQELDDAVSRNMPNIDARAFVAQGLPDPAQLTASLAFAPQTVRPDPIEVAQRAPMPVSPYRKSARAN